MSPSTAWRNRNPEHTPGPPPKWRPRPSIYDRQFYRSATMPLKQFNKACFRLVRQYIAHAEAGLLEHATIGDGIDGQGRDVASLVVGGEAGGAEAEAQFA